MTERVLGPSGSRRRKTRLLLLTALTMAAFVVFFVGNAQAIHDLKFQLDGDVSTTAGTVPATNPLNDWGQNSSNTGTISQDDPSHGVFHVVNTANGGTRPGGSTCSDSAGCQDVVPNGTLVPSPFDAASFQRDFQSGSNCTLFSQSTTSCTGDNTTYSTGSKDTLGIGNGGWQCGNSANVNSKIDIVNAYVASTHNAAGDLIEYFALEKNKNNGTNDVGVWFLQNDASCSSTGANINFTGGHRNGDVLVVSEFTNGGGVSTVKAFRWRASTDPTSPFFGDGGCIDSHNTSDSNYQPKLGGCDNTAFGTGNDCKTQGTGPTDILCATTNANCTDTTKPCSKTYNGIVATPWLSWDATGGVGNTQIVSPDFYEGGINITQAFAQGGGGTAPSCFSTAVPDTRSAASATATLFDFTRNRLGGCTSGTSTRPSYSLNGTDYTQFAADGSGTVAIPTAASGNTLTVKDTASITVTGVGSFGGKVKFFLCGPLAASTTSNCESGGAQIPNSSSTGETVTGVNGAASVDSQPATLTSVGRYCWRAEYSGDSSAQVPASRDPASGDTTSKTECFKVTPVTPTLSTSATCSATPCVLGSTLDDTASLTGTANQPGTGGLGGNETIAPGSINPTTAGASADHAITWTLYGPGSGGAAQCTTAISNAPTPSSIDVHGDNTSYGPVSYTSDKVGKYEFAASYPGDGANSNTSAATAVSCDTTGANGEQVTVSGSASSASKQRWLPNDRVVLTGDTNLNGKLDITLYKDADCGAGQNEGAADIVYTEPQITVSNAASGTAFQTTNTTYFVGTKPDGTAGGAAGSYSWLVHYVDNNLTSPTDRCETSTVSPITDSP